MNLIIRRMKERYGEQSDGRLGVPDARPPAKLNAQTIYSESGKSSKEHPDRNVLLLVEVC
jgi:hypothetical protein